jgi:hypothetical protein
MALKSRRWFERLCLNEVNTQGLGRTLASRALELDLGVDNTQGHMLQAVGVVQKFFEEYPHHVDTINASSFDPYKMTGQMLSDWLHFISDKGGVYGRADFKYNFTYFKNAITTKYGGNTTGGGGGDNEFEICLRLVAAFL